VLLTGGAKLGGYEIIGPLGAGGMGEVYRARDTRLNRIVAVKVLGEQLVADPAALARFEREAQAVAALSHPNILAIHDFGRWEGVTYTVSELLEGGTLRARLAEGALPVRKALDYGSQILNGVAAAHARGIMHRDLKPENIFVTTDAVLKILDFGLAKSVQVPVAMQETRLAADTAPGTVLGTAGYMSPEQVRDREVDHRTDIFSFGAVLYEMLTGRRAFRGNSRAETMNSVLNEDPPDFSVINPALPTSVERVVRRCLEKQPSDRFYEAHDVALALEALSGTSSASAPGLTLVPPTRRWLTAVAALALAGLLGYGARALITAPPAAVPIFQRLTFRQGPISSARFAADGATVIYSAAFDGSKRQLYATRPESPDSLRLPYDDTDVVGVSPTGELAIVSDRRTLFDYARPGALARAPMSGGAARAVLDDVQDAAWLPDGSNLVATHVVNGRYRLEFPIGTAVYETGGWISHPRVSPDGTRVAFLDHPIFGDDRGTAAVVDASGHKTTLSPEYGTTQGLAWLPNGREVWFTGATTGTARTLNAATFDGHVRTVLRIPGSLTLDDIAPNGDVLIVHDSVHSGTRALAPGESKERDLSWFDWSLPSDLSADGRMVLISEEGDGGGPGYSAYLRPTNGSPAIRLGVGEPWAISPDGKWVVVNRLDPAPAQLELVPTGVGQSRPLTDDAITHVRARFSPDGQKVIFVGFEPNRPARTWIQSIAGGPSRPVTPEGVQFVAVSPDGTRVIAADMDGEQRLFPIAGGPPQTIKGLEKTDTPVAFTADGRGLFLRSTLSDSSVQVSRIDLASGARTPVRQIAPPPESLGSGGIGLLRITPDGRGYAFGYEVTMADLYIVKGLK